MIKDEDGISKVIEFTIAFAVFLLILASYFNAIDNRFTPQEREDAVLLNKAISISNFLIGDAGFIMDSDNGSTNWENYPQKSNSINLNDNISRIGFASNKNGVLSYNKISAIGNFTYTQLKEIFNLDLYDFNITIYLLGQENNPISIFGLNYNIAERMTIVTRIVNILFENDVYVSAKMETRVFLYGRSTERIIINEFMYNPESRESKDQWVEVYNPTYLAINLTNWSIGTSNAKSRIIGYEDKYDGKGAIIPSKSYAVVAPETKNVRDSYKNYDTVWLGLDETKQFGSNGLSFFDGEIIIEKYGSIIDSVFYNNSWGGDGKSLQKRSPFSNNSADNWLEHDNDTPGKENIK